jgi:tetraacyldisaccharide 4'-kinase
MLAGWLQRHWFEQRRLSPALWFLIPLSWLFAFLARVKKLNTVPVNLPVPVIVVGNITVGGAGKTPLTIWLARQLVKRGWRPGIVSRGYGGSNVEPREVLIDAAPAEVGDEPVLLARRSGVPVWVGRDRAAAAKAMLQADPAVNMVLCDDGLQHYRLGRDVELAVFDGRGAGNGWRLPVGPLREALSRLNSVDAVVCNGWIDQTLPPAILKFDMQLRANGFYRLDDPAQTCVAGDLAGKKLFALAGIGDPGRFFRTLGGLGLGFEAHPFPDHHAYSRSDLAFADDGILLLTEKDAVKCAALKLGEAWVLPVEAELSSALIDHILEKLRGRQVA